MKLNYRDKIILGALLAFVILLAGFFMAIKPKYKDIKDNKDELIRVQNEKDEIDKKIAEIKPLKEEIKATYDETTKLTDDFVEYNDIFNPRKVDQYMQNFAEDCEVKIKQLSVADLSTQSLDYYYFTSNFVGEDMIKGSDLNGDKQAQMDEKRAESDALSARAKETVMAATYSITVTAEDKEKLWDYMEALKEQKETVIIDSVALTNVAISDEAEKILNPPGEEKKEISAKFDITLYSVYDLAEPNLEAD